MQGSKIKCNFAAEFSAMQNSGSILFLILFVINLEALSSASRLRNLLIVMEELEITDAMANVNVPQETPQAEAAEATALETGSQADSAVETVPEAGNHVESETSQTEEMQTEMGAVPSDEPQNNNAQEGPRKVTKDVLLEDLRALLNQEVSEIREQVEQVKSQFYRLYREEQALARKKFEELGGNIEEYQPVVDDIEQNFKQLITIYKQQRAAIQAKKEEEMRQNQLRKENIVAQMKEIADAETVDIAENLKKVRELQAEWKTIGAVPSTVANELWKQFNLYQEKFYDLVKINNELRDYDFRKNLESKTALCEQAEKLVDEPDVVQAFRMLQVLHDEWANIGPVAKEVREELWARFKAASTVINKKHQDYFASIHEKEVQNLQMKQDIIDEIKAIKLDELSMGKMWDEATERLNNMQERWRSIGFAPKKDNQRIYDEYRALCDEFFAKRNAFYKQIKDTLSINLQRKKDLVQKAQELCESTDWKATTEKIIALQKQWREVGPVARKYSDEVWGQFTAACDKFFALKKEANADQIKAEKDHLQQKRAIIEQISQMKVTTKEETLSHLRDLIGQYNAIGFVPFREKDKLYKQFKEATDSIFDQLHVDAQNRRMESFSKEVEGKDQNTLANDRRKLVRLYETLQAEIKTAENNILFFTAKSNKSGKLLDEMQRKIEGLKEQLKDLEKRINLIDKKLE